MSPSKKIYIYLNRDFAAGVLLSEASSLTHCLHTCIQYTNSHREGGRGAELKQREGERGMTDCISNL